MAVRGDRRSGVQFSAFGEDRSADTEEGDRANAPVLFAPGLLVAERYRLATRIARGGMGSVWAARDEHLGREVAIKFMSPDLASDAGSRARFEQEARAAAKLSNPHVVTLFDHGVWESVPYIVFERLIGVDLQLRLRHPGPLPDALSVLIATHLARALDAAHADGIVHRDVKPQNVFLVGAPGTPDDEIVAKLLDFGVAKQEGASALRTKTGILIGSPHFMSPEQVRGERPLGPASDRFSLASLLYRCVVGRLPFDGDDAGRVLVQITQDTSPPPTSIRGDLPGCVDVVFAKALSRDPAERHETAKELASALKHALTTPSRASESHAVDRAGLRDPGAPVASLEPRTAPITLRAPPPAEELLARNGPRSDAPTSMVTLEQATGFSRLEDVAGGPSPWTEESLRTRPTLGRRSVRAAQRSTTALGWTLVVALLVAIGLGAAWVLWSGAL